MRRTLLMIAAVALLLTQCRKPVVEYPAAEPTNENMVSMTVTVGHGGKTDINGTTGAITWSAGDKLYVGDGSKYIGCLTLQGAGGSATGTFIGTVSAIAGDDYTFGFYYLGSKDYTSGLNAGTSTSVAISFAEQDGRIGNLSDCHIGYGTATGKVKDENVILDSTDPVTMTSKVAIAYFDFKENGTSDYTGGITLSGANICNEMTVKFSGAEDVKFTGKEGTAGKAISLRNTSNSKKYVMLVPPATAVEETLEFGGGAEGSTKFYKGIEANKFYCLGEGKPIEVSVTPKPKFTVGKDGYDNPITVEFSPGNLWADATDAENPVFHFESNQWDTKPAYSETDEGYGTWSSSHVSHFKWSNAKNAVSGDYVYSGNLFCNESFTVTGDSHNDWRTLSYDEWSYLIGESGSGRDASLCKWSTVTFGGSGPTVNGLIIMPDDWKGTLTETTEYTTWQELEASGAVFLPAAGCRYGTDVDLVGSYGNYWSSTPYGDNEGYAYYMIFDSGVVYTDYVSRDYGHAVRLVR